MYLFDMIFSLKLVGFHKRIIPPMPVKSKKKEGDPNAERDDSLEFILWHLAGA